MDLGTQERRDSESVEESSRKMGKELPRAGGECVLSHPGGFPRHLSQPGKAPWDPRGFPGTGRREVGV